MADKGVGRGVGEKGVDSVCHWRFSLKVSNRLDLGVRLL